MVAKKNIVIKQRERESVVVEEKKMISSSKSVQGFLLLPTKHSLHHSPQSEPPPATAYLHTHTLFLFAQFTCREYSMVVAVLCKCVCFVDLFSRRKTLLLELKSVGAIN